MNARPTIDFAEATRLTREGRLDEAMAVLRGAPSAAAGSPDAPKETAPRGSTILDMVPPAIGSTGAWTMPTSGEPRMGSAAAGAGPSRIPEALRGFMDKMARHAPMGNLDGLAGAGRVGPALQLPDGARFDQRSFANEAGRRDYKLYVPSGYTGQPLPLVVMLHGCTQSPDDFAAGTRMNDLAEERTFLVAYPAQTQSANMSKCWNWFSAGDQQRDKGEPSLIAGITRQVMGDFPVEPGRVYIAGLSAGGAAAAIMGQAYPDLYAAVGVHSGLACGAARDMPSAFAAMQKGAPGGARPRAGAAVATIVFHGDRDTTVHAVNGDQVIAQASAAASLTSARRSGTAPGGIGYTQTVHEDPNGRAVLEQWVLHGAGHAWSGGSAAGSYTEPRGPDASREMMRFFMQQPVTEPAS
jgi:poly(hydroxyalkanoate) depolymerase family esterase